MSWSVQRVAQVQGARHVRRRDNHAKRLAAVIRLAVKVAAFFPEPIPAVLRGEMVVLLGKF
jgi:hypothetical protein